MNIAPATLTLLHRGGLVLTMHPPPGSGMAVQGLRRHILAVREGG
jgi:hypothetical protein